MPDQKFCREELRAALVVLELLCIQPLKTVDYKSQDGKLKRAKG
jgi:hypothetical protein